MTHPDRAVALLRVVVGLWFVKAVWTKVSVAAGAVPYPFVSPRFIAFHPKRVAEFAAGNPIGWYKDFLETTVLPHAALFATLQTIGEVAVGVGLLFGIMTRLAALVGLFLAINFGLATQWMSFGQQGFHLLLTTSMVIFLVTGAGRVWGVDRWLSRARGLRWLATLVFVVNENDSAVSIIDVASGRIVKKIEVGTEPETAVASPDGRWIAVSNETSNDVHLIDTATQAVVKKVPVPKNPRGVRFSADSRRLFVASEQAHVVSVVSMDTLAVEKSAATGGSRPVDITLSRDGKRAWWTALTPDGSRLYVTVGRAGEVAVTDTAAARVTGRTPAGKLPWGITIV